MSKEKIYLNGIPVFRSVEGDRIKYVLFEDNDETSHVIYMTNAEERNDEYGIILSKIKNLVYPSGPDKTNFDVRVLIQEYEQSKRDKQWLQKFTQTQAVVDVR